jgi:hypothetical protein
MRPLDLHHHALVEAARVILRLRFKEGYHHVGAALRTHSGRVFAAVHLEAHVGRMAVCAESVAIDMAAAAGVDERVQLVREATCDRYERLEPSALVQRVVVTDDRRQAAEALARRWPQLSPEEILQSPYVLLGTVDQLVEDLQAAGSAGASPTTSSSSPASTPSLPLSPVSPARRHLSNGTGEERPPPLSCDDGRRRRRRRHKPAPVSEPHVLSQACVPIETAS